MVLGGKKWSPPSEEAADEYEKFTVANPAEKLQSLYDGQPGAGSLARTEGPTSAARRITEAINSETPFSMVRMSDGEGNCLFDYDEYPALKHYILDRISFMHFGEGSVVPQNDREFLNMMLQAIDTSDVLGVPEPEAIARGYATPPEELDVRAVVGNRTAALKVAARGGAYNVASPWVNRQLLGHYEEIFAGREAVGVISSHPELGTLMKQRFRIGNVVEHVIPKQAVFVKFEDRKNSQHYPDVFQKIVDSIAPIKPGMPYLVSGGLLAKYYCHVIKSRGGVAIDTGSVPEIWLNIPNRGLSQDYLDQWKWV
ncbi:hypothetical protein [Arthrobacter humicola]|jgi:hypothetical protein